jgi:hypothetical protein
MDRLDLERRLDTLANLAEPVRLAAREGPGA